MTDVAACVKKAIEAHEAVQECRDDSNASDSDDWDDWDDDGSCAGGLNANSDEVVEQDQLVRRMRDLLNVCRSSAKG